MGTELGSVTISNTTAPDVVKNEYFDYARKVTIDDGQQVDTYASFRALVDGSITEVTAEMLEGLTRIKYGCFAFCTNITSIVIPATITSVLNSAFSNCYKLKSVTYAGHVPNFQGYVFQDDTSIAKYDMRHATEVPTLDSTRALGHAKDCKLIVPDALYDEWKAATNWVALTDVVWVKASEYVEE